MPAYPAQSLPRSVVVSGVGSTEPSGRGGGGADALGAGVDGSGEDRALLDAIDLVTARLVSERRVNFQMLGELEQLRDEIERDLRTRPVPAPEDVRGGEPDAPDHAAARSRSSSTRFRSSPPA